jgi:hypothetical protein
LYTEKLREVLSRPHLHQLAISSGFCQRTSKMSPEVFFDMLFYSVSHTEQGSLSSMVSLLQSNFGISMNKQSLNERFNEKCVAYVKAILSEVLGEQFSTLYSSELLPGFSRILIKDSTKFMVPPGLESHYKSCGGDTHSRSGAGVSVQYEYDLKSGEITDLSITSGARNDREDADETAGDVEKDDLIIRDLGYYSTPVFKSWMEKEAFFLSRLDCSTNIYDPSGKPIVFRNIYQSMRKNGMIENEILVCAGKQTRLPVRLILQIVPDEVYEKRIREKTKKSKGQGRGQLMEETKIRCKFNLFITNAEESKLSTKQIYPLYRLRWQIELQFKIWKSVFKINCYHRMKEHRYIALLYVKLLLIIINIQITYSLQKSFIRKNTDKIGILSLNKSLKTLKTLSGYVFILFRGTRRKAEETAQYIKNRLSENHCLESKKKKLCFPEILELIICLSKK